ncbi:MAG: hypothetical protein U0R19_35295 [Bryobacteraceae bacterium]
MYSWLILALIASAGAAWADFRMVQTIRINLNSTLAPAPNRDIMEDAKIPKAIYVDVQGSNLRVRHGQYQVLYLLEGGAVHVIDDTRKVYTTVTLPEWDEFSEHLATSLANPNKDPQFEDLRAKMGDMDWLKTVVERKASGPAEKVLGFQTESNTFEWRFDASAAPDPMIKQMLSGQKFRVTDWTAPAPPQFTELNTAQRKILAMFDAAKAVAKMGAGAANRPREKDEFDKLREQYRAKDRLVVKSVMSMYMDFATLGLPVPENMKNMANEPFSTVTMAIESFDTALLDPAEFVVPATYRRVAIREMELSTMFPAMLR